MVDYTQTDGYVTDDKGRRQYANRDDANHVKGTEIEADDHNQVRNELVYTVKQAGITPNNGDDTQLYQAIGKIADERAASAEIGFTPVQQGGIDGLTDDKVQIGNSANGLAAYVSGKLVGVFAYTGTYLPLSGGIVAWLNVKGALNVGVGGGFNGGVAQGSFRWTNPITFGNPSASSNSAFCGGLQIGDIVGDATNNQSGINLFGYNYSGTRYNWYLSWNGNIITPKGTVAFVSDVAAETTRATTIEGNLQSQKVDKSTGAMSALSVSIGAGSFVMSNTDAPGYATWMRATSTGNDGVLDVYSNAGTANNNVMRICADGSVRIIGGAGGWFYVEDVRVALQTDISGLQNQVNGKQAAGDYATNTALINGLAGKLDISTYQADFNSGDSRVHDSPYGKRTQHFRTTANAGDYITFPQKMGSVDACTVQAEANTDYNCKGFNTDNNGTYLHINSGGTNVQVTVLVSGTKP